VPLAAVTSASSAAAGQAGLPVIKLHSARHSAISTMADAGVDRDLRKVAVGHSADDVHDRYTHRTDTALRDAAARRKHT
jgi:integrase